ncbi:MAG: 4'-phosphopantetheinyl transferase superfamily protein [Verrucomicrobiaceae bacterium]|nr:4'-phosphopantetheinyl transferase superfamily protein [Verrucomicrobiaceae bacterium]
MSGPAEIRAGEIVVTPFRLDETSSLSLELARSWLNEEERARADRFKFGIHRDRFTRGRGVLRHLLAASLGKRPESLVFATGERGKPYLPGTDLHFNLSHSEDRAVLALSRLECVGIDLERYDRSVDIDGLSRRCFRESEIARFEGMDEAEKRRAFFWIWTAKEARMKATGEGFHLEPRRIEVAFSKGLPSRYLAPDHPPAYVRPAVLPGDETACSVAALAPFQVVLTAPPVFPTGSGSEA